MCTACSIAFLLFGLFFVARGIQFKAEIRRLAKMAPTPIAELHKYREAVIEGAVVGPDLFESPLTGERFAWYQGEMRRFTTSVDATTGRRHHSRKVYWREESLQTITIDDGTGQAVIESVRRIIDGEGAHICWPTGADVPVRLIEKLQERGLRELPGAGQKNIDFHESALVAGTKLNVRGRVGPSQRLDGDTYRSAPRKSFQFREAIVTDRDRDELGEPKGNGTFLIIFGAVIVAVGIYGISLLF